MKSKTQFSPVIQTHIVSWISGTTSF